MATQKVRLEPEVTVETYTKDSTGGANHAAGVDMHTKQLADKWGVTSRVVTEIRLRCERKGWGEEEEDGSYRMGRVGERNRVYFSPEEQHLLLKERYNQLEANPKAQSTKRKQKFRFTEDQGQVGAEGDHESKNNNIENYHSALKSSAEIKDSQQKAGFKDGLEIARHYHEGRTSGVLTGLQASNQAISEMLNHIRTGGSEDYDPLVLKADLEETSERFLEESF